MIWSDINLLMYNCSDAIITWVKKKIGPAVSIVQSAEDVLEKEIPVAVAYLDSVTGKDAEELSEVAKKQDGVEFYMTADAQIANEFGLDKKSPALVLLKKQNEKVVTFGTWHFIRWTLNPRHVWNTPCPTLRCLDHALC